MRKNIKSGLQPLIIVLGGGIQQTRCIKRCQQLGYMVCCFDMNDKCYGASVADLFFQISIKKFDKIVSVVASLKNVVAILAPASEIGNITACRLAANFSLCYNSEKVVTTTNNKSLMRKKIASLGLDNPLYFTIPFQVSGDEASCDGNKTGNFPCIVKPVDSSAGRGISICNTPADLEEGVTSAIEASEEGLAIVESIIDGPQFSIETLSFNGEHAVIAVVAQTMDLKEKHVEVGHILPAPISNKMHSILVEYALKLLDGFEIQFGACHIEVRIVGKKIYTLDFASRMGGWRDVMIESILGNGYIDAFIKSHLPEEAKIQKLTACYEPLSENSFCVARMVFTFEDQLLLDDLIKEGKCEFDSVDRVMLDFRSSTLKSSLSDSAGHFLYKSDLSNERLLVTKYRCVDLTTDFI